MTTPTDRVTRTISSFDARSRQILTNGGTVRGGNGITYRYDPLTGMAVNANRRPTAAPTTTSSASGATPPPRGPQSPATRAGVDNPTSTVQPTAPSEVVPQQPGPVTPTAADPLEIERFRQEREDQLRAEQQEQQRRDAYARLNAVLNDYGLGSLGQTVQQWLVEGLSEAEIVQRMRETTEFKTRFPAIEERKRKGLTPISPGEYVAYERSARQAMRAAGLPPGFYDSTDDFTTFLANDVSIAELADRVTLARNAAVNTTEQERQALAEFGLNPGEITAFWLDPDKALPLLERRYAAAQLSGAARQTGFGSLDEQTATSLVQQGVSRDAARAGFGDLVQQRELFTSLDAGEDMIGRQEQLDAQFGGSGNARRRIEQRARRRRAQFEAGGGFAASQQGLVGLGDTQ